MCSDVCAWDEDLPDAAIADPHGVPSCVPVVEVTDKADHFRVRSPHSESDAAHGTEFNHMRPERVKAFVVRAFAVQVPDLALASYRRP